MDLACITSKLLCQLLSFFSKLFILLLTIGADVLKDVVLALIRKINWNLSLFLLFFNLPGFPTPGFGVCVPVLGVCVPSVTPVPSSPSVETGGNTSPGYSKVQFEEKKFPSFHRPLGL